MVVDVSPEVAIEQVRRVIQGMGWTVQKIEILEGNIVQLVILRRPRDNPVHMEAEGIFKIR